MPGVEVHANLLNQLQEGRVLRRATPGADLVATWVLALLAAASVLFLGPLAAFGLAGGFAAAYTLLAMETLVGQGVWVSLTLPWFAWTLSLLAAAGYRYWTEARGRQAIKSAFGMYLAPEVVETHRPGSGGGGVGGRGEGHHGGFLRHQGFHHRRGGAFSPGAHDLSERVSLGGLRGRSSGRRGWWTSTSATPVMMIFGAPNEMGDHPARACRAALSIRDAIRRGEDQWARLGRSEPPHRGRAEHGTRGGGEPGFLLPLRIHGPGRHGEPGFPAGVG